jgi:formylglycine-generating enzyme required for sulfatase activity
MVEIQGGTFMMGSPTSEPKRQNDENQHQVTLTQGFYMGKYPITQAQYQAVMGENPSSFKVGGRSGTTPSTLGSITDTTNFPVETVTWYDAVEFCNKLSENEGRTLVYTISGRTPATGYPITSATVTANWSAGGYRLPTEAQWEYVCRSRGVDTTPFVTGNNITTDQANYDGNYPYNGNPKGVWLSRTTAVGSYTTNSSGIYDMHGNVEEWCWDGFGNYSDAGSTDPTGSSVVIYRVRRGGSWGSDGDYVRSAYRGSLRGPGETLFYHGFRVVRALGGVGIVPTITTATLPGGTVGTAYSQTLAVTGSPPITWSLDSGALPTGLSLSTTGVISGMPATMGTFTFTVKATNGVGNNTKQFSVTIVGVPPTITTASLPVGAVETAYNQTLTATGNTPITWSLDSGTLPAGLNLAGNGAITGAPTAAGTSTFTVRATNAAGNNTKQFSITIGIAPIVFGGALPGGEVGQAYNHTLMAERGDTPITWSLDSGALPAGLSLAAATGVISGTPTALGRFTFTIKATNAFGNYTNSFVITIGTPPIIVSGYLIGGRGTAFNQTLTATGSTPITWSLYSGTLPAGLSLSGNGVIAGTPTETGWFNFGVRATNAVGSVVSQLTIIIQNTPLIITETLPFGTAGITYSQTLAAAGATPITWSIDSGTLPAGLSLAPTTGVISGLPFSSAEGISTFTVKAANSAGVDTKQLSITITGGRNQVSIEMVEIPGGTFQMGSPDGVGYSDERPQHQVTLTGFRMGKYEVTQALYQAVMGYNPSWFKTPVSPETSTVNRPVETVSWYDAVEFCNKLSELEGLTPAYVINDRYPATGYPILDATVNLNWWDTPNGYRLPTEAEWEYACRAGTTTLYNTGDTISDSTGWYDANSNGRTHSVGEKPANAWGLYDMHGNVGEWCWDPYGRYWSDPETDPTGPSVSNDRVIRGGSWYSYETWESGRYLRSAARQYSYELGADYTRGFRVVRPLQ